MQVIFYKREIIPCSASTDCNGATHCEKTDVISLLHMPLHPSGDVVQACINDSNATWGVRHFSRHECSSYRYPAVDTRVWTEVHSGGVVWRVPSSGAAKWCVRKAQQPNNGYPTLASSLMLARVEKLSKHRLSNTDFCRCRCLPSSGCPKTVWATSCCGRTATEANDVHRRGTGLSW